MNNFEEFALIFSELLMFYDGPACVMSPVTVCFLPLSVCVCVCFWLDDMFVPDLLCFVSHSYFLGELEKCVGDPESLAQLFIKHVSL